MKVTPVTQFRDLGLAAPILKAIIHEGYTNPTPIQQEVIPAMMAGRDIIGIAQTGTGKTAAFVLPILHKIYNEKHRPEPKCCNALIVAPTRELAAQIVESIRAYGRNMRHSVTLVVGGAKARPQIMALSRGVDIVVATPGRLLDHKGTGAIRLDQTTTVILDEADQMMDLGFIPAIREIMQEVSKTRQTLLLSATMPKQIRALAQDFLNKPAEIAVAAVSTPVERIEQRVFHVEQGAKLSKLVETLKSDAAKCSIVFTRTKRGADKVNFHLVKAGLQSAAIHGDKTQGQREKVLRNFKNGHTTVLVATDIAARGIDVDGVTHVINYELPNVPEVYIHRIGRTARAGESGIALSFVDDKQRTELRDIERLIGFSFDIYGDGSMVKLPASIAPIKKHGRGPKKPFKNDSPRKKPANKRFSKGGKGRDEGEKSAYRYDGPDFTPEADRAPDGTKVEFNRGGPAKPKKGGFKRKVGETAERRFGDKREKPKAGEKRKASPHERKRNSKYFGKRQKAKASTPQKRG